MEWTRSSVPTTNCVKRRRACDRLKASPVAGAVAAGATLLPMEGACTPHSTCTETVRELQTVRCGRSNAQKDKGALEQPATTEAANNQTTVDTSTGAASKGGYVASNTPLTNSPKARKYPDCEEIKGAASKGHQVVAIKNIHSILPQESHLQGALESTTVANHPKLGASSHTSRDAQMSQRSTLTWVYTDQIHAHT
eukprot:1144208-Pelagomonas_calceolata.AAC.2